MTDDSTNPAQRRVVGTPQIRKEGAEKVLGRAKYVDDIEFPGMWHGATVRSTIPRGRILAIHFDESVPWHEFVIVTAADIPGNNHIQMIAADQPCLADGAVNHCDEPILLIAHPDKRLLPQAVASVRIDYEELPAVLSIEESESKREIIWGADTSTPNVFKEFVLQKGNVDEAWSSAACIVEGEYSTGAQEHLYIENNGMIADYSDDGGITVWGSLQCPFYVHKSLMAVFNLPEDKVRVIQTETGGAFGGKEDYPSIIASHAALLALKARRPIKMIYDRMEDLAATTKRHPSRTRHRTAVDKDGKLLAMEIEIATDGGAYSTLSSTVLSRATLHATGPYVCPNIRIRSRAWATNTVPYGAFRGFGAPQTIFAIERHMEHIALAVGMDPVELRRRNFLHDGDTTATQQIMREPVILDQLLDRALAVSDFYAKRERYARENATNPVKCGIGIAAFYHGSGFTGSGERRLNSLAGVDVTLQGKVRVLVSSTEFGQGTNTILAQIAAEALGISYDDVEMAPSDTHLIPNSGPTVASRTSMVVGHLIQRSGRQLIQTLKEAANLSDNYTRHDFFAACELLRARDGEVKSLSRYEAPPNIYWNDDTYTGEAYPAFAWAVYVAEVAVDTITYSAEVIDFHTVQEVGTVLNPTLAAGQIEGGVAQGIGYALYEKVQLKNGHMFNNQMTNYIMPTAQDVPPIHVYFEQIPFAYGAFGAKGIGELPHDGPAPAILNAIQNATGESFSAIPLLPEDIFLRFASYGLDPENITA
ncbi:xanthine dehydrogenase family protein molybdopterin-binding subunit [Acidicapsa dinghuensis]|uniref:Xanthine dehydrogenase family protein molybdopterin-binding subunit n=1 Tax=Acidicapsa dinghuensis TaxID=2218256 RepID=A0ABW1ENG1_9BACT|nr:xanthine dehydrogenase family protein molybdopterin-binding subunit [Acidicapsa dinghuensis]